jgi:hypothetical protein
MQQVRRAARERAEESSLRTAAPEIGIGHSTLHNFLNGANPHPRIRRILHNWYVERLGGKESELRSCLDRLLAEFPDDVANGLRPAMTRLLADGYIESGIEVPAWVVAPSGGSAGPSSADPQSGANATTNRPAH